VGFSIGKRKMVALGDIGLLSSLRLALILLVVSFGDYLRSDIPRDF
jgi:hypothetical protein